MKYRCNSSMPWLETDELQVIFDNTDKTLQIQRLWKNSNDYDVIKEEATPNMIRYFIEVEKANNE
jgi:TusA-related sulfurtransferase